MCLKQSDKIMNLKNKAFIFFLSLKDPLNPQPIPVIPFCRHYSSNDHKVTCTTGSL